MKTYKYIGVVPVDIPSFVVVVVFVVVFVFVFVFFVPRE